MGNIWHLKLYSQPKYTPVTVSVLGFDKINYAIFASRFCLLFQYACPLFQHYAHKNCAELQHQAQVNFYSDVTRLSITGHLWYIH